MTGEEVLSVCAKIRAYHEEGPVGALALVGSCRTDREFARLLGALGYRRPAHQDVQRPATGARLAGPAEKMSPGYDSAAGHSPRDSRSAPLKLSKVHWVKPELVVEVTYLRGPVRTTYCGRSPYQGQREDKPALQVARSTLIEALVLTRQSIFLSVKEPSDLRGIVIVPVTTLFRCACPGRQSSTA